MKIGDYLYATCSGDDYGKIIAIGQDTNGTPTIDIEWYDHADIANEEEFDDKPNLMWLEVPKGVTLILRDLQYKMWKPWDDGTEVIECNTPGNGCFRCSKLFIIRECPKS